MTDESFIYLQKDGDEDSEEEEELVEPAPQLAPQFGQTRGGRVPIPHLPFPGRGGIGGGIFRVGFAGRGAIRGGARGGRGQAQGPPPA